MTSTDNPDRTGKSGPRTSITPDVEVTLTTYSQPIRFDRVSSHVDDFNTRYKVLTAKLLRQGYRYQKLRKAFSKFYRRHF